MNRQHMLNAGGEEYNKYKQQVAQMVKEGQLVVQMLAAEESITMPDGSRKATFTQDTWDMVSIDSPSGNHKQYKSDPQCSAHALAAPFLGH